MTRLTSRERIVAVGFLALGALGAVLAVVGSTRGALVVLSLLGAVIGLFLLALFNERRTDVGHAHEAEERRAESVDAALRAIRKELRALRREQRGTADVVSRLVEDTAAVADATRADAESAVAELQAVHSQLRGLRVSQQLASQSRSQPAGRSS